MRCAECGFTFSFERPPEDELAGLYRDMDVAVYEAEKEGRRRTAQRHFDIVSTYVEQGSLLDVGCGSGVFLHLAAQHHWKVCGVEPCLPLYRKAETLLRGRGTLSCSTLQEASLRAASFDVITLWDVLEHVPDPAGFLEHCRGLLKPGGYVFVNVPDADSLPARLLGEHWPLWLPEHLNYFNRQSLRLCGKRAKLTHVGFDRRPTAFSVGYILHRLSQHRIPAAGAMHRAVGGTSLGKVILPIQIGELLAVWRRDG